MLPNPSAAGLSDKGVGGTGGPTRTGRVVPAVPGVGAGADGGGGGIWLTGCLTAPRCHEMILGKGARAEKRPGGGPNHAVCPLAVDWTDPVWR